MTTSTLARGSRSAPYTSALDPDTAARLAATEYARVVSVLEQLDADQWATPTDCPGWDVRAMAGHMLGMTRMASSMLESLRQQRVAKRRQKREGGPGIDALTALQVDEQAALTADEVVERIRTLGPRAARSRFRTPGLLLRTTIDPQVIDGREEWWTLGYLLHTILTRDPFMHRIDIARATGVEVPATAGHEGVIVDDVAREWAARHGAPCRLELTGPAGGTWTFGDGATGEQLSMDAFEFCRVLSGRAGGTGLLGVQVPF